MAAQPGSLDIVQGQSGQIEGKSVGVAWTAEDGTSAQIVCGIAEARPGNLGPPTIVSLATLVEVTITSIGEARRGLGHAAVARRPATS